MDENVDLKGNIDIQEALKEFEVKSGAPEIKKIPEPSQVPPAPPKEVAEVRFDEDQWRGPAKPLVDETPKMVKLIMKWSGGAITEQRQAEYILLSFVLLALGVSFYLFFAGGSTPPPIPPAVIEQMQQPLPGSF